jgi:hypothetical protein
VLVWTYMGHGPEPAGLERQARLGRSPRRPNRSR